MKRPARPNDAGTACQASNDQDKLIVAIDFGTSFSAAAWAHTGNADVQQLITQWPDPLSQGSDGLSSGKVPTELQYADGSIRWGYEIPPTETRHAWFKLELEPHQYAQSYALAADLPDRRTLPPGYEPEGVITDYLKKLREHVEQSIADAIPASALGSTKIHYILTCPAVWSEAAQARTQSCAMAAGLGSSTSLKMISEPEAAAAYVLNALNPHGLSIGSTFVLCDAGGGTVDLISYTITAFQPILQVKEAAAGSGALCGSTFINRAFEKFLRDRFSQESGWDEEIVSEALDRFELVVKRRFTGDENARFWIPVHLPDNPRLGVRRGQFHLSGRQIKEFFKPSLEGTLRLVKAQVNAMQARKPEAILLVGGFGQSPVLRQFLRDAYKKDGIEVVQPPNGWTAVVSGALLKGLLSGLQVRERVARKHYGLSTSVIFNPAIHDFARSWIDPFDDERKISGFTWIIKKNEPIEECKPRSFSFRQKRLASNGFRTSRFGCTVYECRDDEGLGPPVYQDEGRARPLTTLTPNLEALPANAIERCRGNNGENYLYLDYQVAATFQSASTQYELVHKDVKYGKILAEFA